MIGKDCGGPRTEVSGSALDYDPCAAQELQAPLDGSPALIGQHGAKVAVMAGHHRPTGAGTAARRRRRALRAQPPAREGAPSRRPAAADRPPAIPC
jgi:hypothetical protein